MKISNKKFMFVLVYALLTTLLFSISFAYNVPQPNNDVNVSQIEGPIQSVLGVMKFIGIVIAVGMVMYAGIKYLTSGAGEKAKAKEQLVPIAIGAALIALAPTIVEWLLTAFGA